MFNITAYKKATYQRIIKTLKESLDKVVWAQPCVEFGFQA